MCSKSTIIMYCSHLQKFFNFVWKFGLNRIAHIISQHNLQVFCFFSHLFFVLFFEFSLFTLGKDVSLKRLQVEIVFYTYIYMRYRIFRVICFALRYEAQYYAETKTLDNEGKLFLSISTVLVERIFNFILFPFCMVLVLYMFHVCIRNDKQFFFEW